MLGCVEQGDLKRTCNVVSPRCSQGTIIETVSKDKGCSGGTIEVKRAAFGSLSMGTNPLKSRKTHRSISVEIQMILSHHGLSPPAMLTRPALPFGGVAVGPSLGLGSEP